MLNVNALRSIGPDDLSGPSSQGTSSNDAEPNLTQAQSSERLRQHVRSVETQHGAAPPAAKDFFVSSSRLTIREKIAGGQSLKLGHLRAKNMSVVAKLEQGEPGLTATRRDVITFLYRKRDQVFLRVRVGEGPPRGRLVTFVRSITNRMSNRQWTNHPSINGVGLLAFLAGLYGQADLLSNLVLEDGGSIDFRAWSQAFGGRNRLLTDATFAQVFHELVMGSMSTDNYSDPNIALRLAKALVEAYFGGLPLSRQEMESRMQLFLEPYGRALIDGRRDFVSECLGTALGALVGGLLSLATKEGENKQEWVQIAGYAIQGIQVGLGYIPFCGPVVGWGASLTAQRFVQHFAESNDARPVAAHLVSGFFSRMLQEDRRYNANARLGIPVPNRMIDVHRFHVHLHAALMACEIGLA